MRMKAAKGVGHSQHEGELSLGTTLNGVGDEQSPMK